MPESSRKGLMPSRVDLSWITCKKACSFMGEIWVRIERLGQKDYAGGKSITLILKELINSAGGYSADYFFS
jgi:hypothetical protein